MLGSHQLLAARLYTRMFYQAVRAPPVKSQQTVRSQRNLQVVRVRRTIHCASMTITELVARLFAGPSLPSTSLARLHLLLLRPSDLEHKHAASLPVTCNRNPHKHDVGGRRHHHSQRSQPQNFKIKNQNQKRVRADPSCPWPTVLFLTIDHQGVQCWPSSLRCHFL